MTADLTPLESRILAFIELGEGTFDALAMELHEHQKAACAAYRAFCATQPAPSRWSEIPATPLPAFRQFAIRTFPAAEITRTFRTSGTTGEGYGEHFFRTLALYRAAALGGWTAAGLPLGHVVCLVPPPSAAPHSSLSCMAGWLVEAGGGSLDDCFFVGDWPRLAAALEAATQPVTVFGTALAFLDFFESPAGSPRALPPGSIAIETGGYKGTRRTLEKSALHELFTARLGLPSDAIWNEYGMTELSSQFYTHGLGRVHRGARWVRALVLDPETGREVDDGQTGILRIFDLANAGSCCALETRDLAIRRGDAFELIGRDPAALPRGCSRAADEALTPPT